MRGRSGKKTVWWLGPLESLGGPLSKNPAFSAERSSPICRTTLGSAGISRASKQLVIWHFLSSTATTNIGAKDIHFIHFLESFRYIHLMRQTHLLLPRATAASATFSDSELWVLYKRVPKLKLENSSCLESSRWGNFIFMPRLCRDYILYSNLLFHS